MLRIRKLGLVVLTAILSVGTAAPSADAFAQQTTRVSVSTGGEPSNMAAGQGAISANGRYVVFSSAATNLVDPAVWPSTLNIFRRDRVTGVTVQVNVNRFGFPSSNSGLSPSISADGQRITFASLASDVVDGDNNGLMDVFVRDMQTNATKLVSSSAMGVQGDQVSGFSGIAGARAISDDGRYVVFNSAATTLVPESNNGKQQIYRKDTTTGTIVRVSMDNTGAGGDDNSSFGVISGNGNLVAFRSESTNFSDLTPTHSSQIFVRDITAATTTLESVTTEGVVNLSVGSSAPAISYDGNYVAFESSARLNPRDLDNGTLDVFLRDRTAHTTVLASNSTLAVAGAPSRNASVSGDGRYVGFNSLDDQLVVPDVGGLTDVFVYDRQTGTITLVSRNDAGEQASGFGSNSPSLSFDGRLVTFQSTALNFGSPVVTQAQVYIRILQDNQPPVVEAGAAETVTEGTWLKRFGNFSDVDTSTSWTGTYDFGAGAFPLGIDPVKKMWFFQHEPLTPGMYVVTLSITDNQGATGSSSFRHTVTNVAPTVNLGAEASLYFDATLHRLAGLGDPGLNWPVPQPAETYSATVDYGDGTGVAPLALNGSQFTLDHTYANSGTYVVTVNALDSNGDTGSGSLTVHVFRYSYEFEAPVGTSFVVGRNLPVMFTVRGPDAAPFFDPTVRVDVVDESGTVMSGPYVFGDQPSRAVTWSSDSYHVNVDTRGLVAGMYWLRVQFSSPALTDEFRLATTGTATTTTSRTLR